MTGILLDGLLWFGFFAGIAAAALTFALNSSTPVQIGPIPFFGGVALTVLCAAILIARHVAWR